MALWHSPKFCARDGARTISASRCYVRCALRPTSAISERNRPANLGGPDASPQVQLQDESNRNMAGRVLEVDDVAAQVVRAITANQLYILPHEESRKSIRRRFDRIDRAFEEKQ